jgi:DNA repair protein RadC
MSITALVREEGPRDRYTRTDGDGFGDLELLALVLGTGTATRTPRAIAADLLDRFGGPAGIAAAPVHALALTHGVGPARAVRIHAACRLSRRAAPRGTRRVRSASDAWLALRSTLEGLLHEELHALYLDGGSRVRLHRRLSVGTARFTFVDPPSVLGPALACGASAILVAHNHPGGDPEPSAADLESTRRLALAAQAVGVPLLDHLVIGDGCYVSLAERGLLEPWGEPPVSTTG